MFAEPLVPLEMVTQQLDAAALKAIGNALDLRLGALAVPGEFERDELTLACLAMVESIFLHDHQRRLDHNAYLAPILDHVLPRYSSMRSVKTIGKRAIDHVRHWIESSADYQQLVGAVLNSLQDRMVAVRIQDTSLVIFYPSKGMAKELRNRWFSQRHYAAKEAAGRELRAADASENIPKIDVFVQREGLWTHDGVDFCKVPSGGWYEQYCEQTLEPLLRTQFEHVGDGERWVGLEKRELLARIRPILLRAAKRLFVHMRAQKILTRERGEPVVLASAVESCDLMDIARDVCVSAGCEEADATGFVEKLIRPEMGEEKCDIMAYPLVRLHENRVAYLPSVVLYGNWPIHLEQAAARTSQGSRIGEVRDRRHLQMIEGWLRAAGYAHVATDVVLRDAAGTTLTDLDVVAVPTDHQSVLVVQLKSFVTPTNLLTIPKAEADVEKAVNQCRVGARHSSTMKFAIERQLGITLPKNWRPYQLIVVEAHTGVSEPDPDFPAVTLEWLQHELSEYGTSPEKLWRAGLDLPDADEFFDSLLPSFALYESWNTPLCREGERIAVFQYGSGRVASRNGCLVVE